MKKRYLACCAALALLAAANLSSCGGKKTAASADSSLPDSSEQTALLPDSIDTGFYLTADSIGPVHVGMALSDIPERCPDLYDTQVPAETPDATAITFLRDMDPVFTIYDFMEGKVDVIVLESPAIGVKIPVEQNQESGEEAAAPADNGGNPGLLCMGDSFEKVLALPGVRSEWAGMDETGMWYWTWNGIWIGVDESDVSDELAQALVTQRHPPRAAMLKTARVGYLATGLPF